MELKLEIEKTRKEIKEVENKLTIEMKNLEIKIEKSHTDLAKFINRQTIWTIGAITIIIGALKVLDYILK